MTQPQTRARLRQARPRRTPGHGFSVLEVIVAIAVISLTVGMVGTMADYASRSIQRDAVHSAAAEAANRLIIQYIEDAADLERQAARELPVRIGDELFRFTLEQQILRIDVESVYDESAGAQVAQHAAMSDNPLADLQDRLRTVRVNIFTTRAVGGYEPGEYVLSLERTYDLLRRGDIIRILRDEFSEIIDQQSGN